MTVTSTKVVEAWLKTLDSVDDTKVGPTLPASSSGWAATNFWQVTSVGGSPHVDLGIKMPVVEVSVWATTENSEFPPYNRAESFATDVRNSAMDQTTTTLNIDGTDVFLMGIWAISEPLRVPDTRTGYARCMVQVELNWEVK